MWKARAARPRFPRYMKHVILYSKVGCHLCDTAHQLVLDLQREYGFALAVVDISQDRALEERYRYAIPVIVIGSEIELSAPIHEGELRAALA